MTLGYKEFQEHGRVFSIAQIEELGFDQFWKSGYPFDASDHKL